MKQHEAVIQSLEKQNGLATLNQLYQEVLKIKECEWKTRTPFASIRRIVQTRKEIYKIRLGLYGLEAFRSKIEAKGIIEENEKNKNSDEIKQFNHSYYQGILLQIGNMKGFQTFLPSQDKKKMFVNIPLENFSTIHEIPEFSYKNIVKRSSSVDVIWFNERMMPNSFIEIEHSTDFQNSLLKYFDLQDFHSRFIIVADQERKREFDKKFSYSAFRQLQKRVEYFDYETVVKYYENALELERKQIKI